MIFPLMILPGLDDTEREAFKAATTTKKKVDLHMASACHTLPQNMDTRKLEFIVFAIFSIPRGLNSI